MTPAKRKSPIIHKSKAELSSSTSVQLISFSRILARQAVREMVSTSQELHANPAGGICDDAS